MGEQLPRRVVDKEQRRQYDFTGSARIRRELLEFTADGVDYYGDAFAALELDGTESLLDIGCGDGEDDVNLAINAGHTGQIIGLEVPAEDFDNKFYLAETDLKEAGKDNVSFQPGLAQDLPFEENTFDVVTLLHSIYHVNQPHKAFHEIQRVLKPAGKLLILTNGKNNKLKHHAILQAIGEQLGATAPPPFSSNFDLDKVKEVVPRYFEPWKPYEQNTQLVIKSMFQLEVFLASLDSYKSSFKPRIDVGEWDAAVARSLFSKQILSLLAIDDAFCDTVERGGGVYLNTRKQQ